MMFKLLEGGTAIDISSILTAIGTFFTSFVTWVGQVLTFITEQPILLVFVILAVAGIVISMVRRWIPGAGV